ncbi:hypothetical protein AV530_002829 [Patagioenas fasciata monilis]|uniref:Uncharacterized protein n=1 Tax=Patagioenas fasciata monilis TaxID=372326 RepID=A0A1V4K9C4_PATFA|nr:hypothetical protein AV530_002829 [Patagioenas fasciata monilis]
MKLHVKNCQWVRLKNWKCSFQHQRLRIALLNQVEPGTGNVMDHPHLLHLCRSGIWYAKITSYLIAAKRN